MILGSGITVISSKLKKNEYINKEKKTTQLTPHEYRVLFLSIHGRIITQCLGEKLHLEPNKHT